MQVLHPFRPPSACWLSTVRLWGQFAELEPEVPPADTCAEGQWRVSYKCKRCLAGGVTQLLGETGCWEGQGEGRGQCPMRQIQRLRQEAQSSRSASLLLPAHPRCGAPVPPPAPTAPSADDQLLTAHGPLGDRPQRR